MNIIDGFHELREARLIPIYDGNAISWWRFEAEANIPVSGEGSTPEKAMADALHTYRVVHRGGAK